MSRKITEPLEEGEPTGGLSGSVMIPGKGRGWLVSFIATVYVDDQLLARVQQDPTHQTALIASASLVSLQVRFSIPGEEEKHSFLP